jgi:hypothetical protein
VQAVALLTGTLIMLYAGNCLVPAINQARDAGPSGHDRFVRLHRRSVQLNVLVLIVGLGLLVVFATRAAPRTEGIVEMSPVQRARYEAAVSRVIEDIETRRGLRPDRTARAEETGKVPAVLDEEAVQEIESFYSSRDKVGAAAPGVRSRAARPGDAGQGAAGLATPSRPVPGAAPSPPSGGPGAR